MIQENDDDDVARNNQQLFQSPKIPAQFTLDVYKPFSDYLKLKYGENDDEEADRNRQKELDYIFSLGIELAIKKLECPILFEEKKPRKDVMCKLGKIANEFQSHPEYPHIKSMVITNTINKIMCSKDKRTKEKYHNCVHQYIGEPKKFGLTDVSEFVNLMPNEYLDTTSSTSSFIDE